MEFRKIVKTLVCKIPLTRALYDDGFFMVPIRLRLVNFFFQRILGVNGNVPFSVHYTSIVRNPEGLKLGRRVRANFADAGGCYIQALNGITIGDNTIFAPRVVIQSHNHDLYLRDISTHEAPIHIGQNCWIGANAVILPGVHIGDYVTIGAGSVVTKDIPNFAVAVGVPCRVIKFLSKDSLDDYRLRHKVVIPSDVVHQYPAEM